jgi:hypothetical protein
MNDRNIGRFTVSGLIIHEDPDIVAEVFGILKMVPVLAEIIYTGDIDYVGLSERFREIPRGEIPPRYKIVPSRNDSGHVEFVEVIEEVHDSSVPL